MLAGDQRKYTYGYAPHYFLPCTTSAAPSSSSIGIFLSRLDISLRLLGIGEITFPITYANVPALRNATREFRLFLFISRLSIVFSRTNHFHFITFVPLVQEHPIRTNLQNCLGASHFHTFTRFIIMIGLLKF